MAGSSITAVVDFGTSHTVTVVSTASGAATLVSVDGAPWCPSAVFWGADQTPSVGADALRLGRAQPARLEPRPKARITEPEVLLADAVVSTTSLIRALLTRVVEQAATVAGGPVQHLALTHPADWGASRLGVLLSAAQGLAPRLSTIAEPIGAAAWFAERHDLPVGAHLAVLDMGGGTCDAAIVSRQPAGLTVAGCAGLPDLGGNDLDERIVRHLRDRHAELDGFLRDLEQGGQVPAQVLVQLDRFRTDVREAKEVLSRYPHADVVLPGRMGEVILTRDEFDGLVRDDLRRAVELLDTTARECDLAPGDLAAVHLVGGSTRVPLLAQLIQEWTSASVRLDDQPEAVVALGAHAIAAGPRTAAVSEPRPPDQRAADPTAPVPASGPGTAPPDEPGAGGTTDTGQARRGRRRWVGPVAAGLVAALVVTLGPALLGDPPTTPGSPSQADDPRATLPAPPEGEPVAFSGHPTQLLQEISVGESVPFSAGSDKVTWQLDEFADDARTDKQVADAGNGDIDAYRWVLVRTTVGARGKATYVDLTGYVYLVDDRGLMIAPSRSAAVPDNCHPEDRDERVQPGDTITQCLVFHISATTPVTEVALSVLGPDNASSPDSELLSSGARVRVSGQRVAGQAADVTESAEPLGTWQQVDINGVGGRVAVVDIVENITGYYPNAVKGLPGYQTVLVRVLADVDDPRLTNTVINRLFLSDDRGTTSHIGSLGLGQPDHPDCLHWEDQQTFTGRATLCLPFVVPTGTPITAIGIAGVDTPYVWSADS